MISTAENLLPKSSTLLKNKWHHWRLFLYSFKIAIVLRWSFLCVHVVGTWRCIIFRAFWKKVLSLIHWGSFYTCLTFSGHYIIYISFTYNWIEIVYCKLKNSFTKLSFLGWAFSYYIASFSTSKIWNCTPWLEWRS